MARRLRQKLLARLHPLFQAGGEAKDYRLVADSGLFDRDWYFDFAPEVEAAGADPVLHFLRTGAAQGRDPGPAFSTRGYLAANPDVAEAGANALLHYLRHGRAEGRRLVPAAVPSSGSPLVGGFEGGGAESAADFRWITPPPTAQGRAVAAIVHVYYPVLWPVMARHLRHIPVPFDLVATLPAPADEAAIAAIRADFPGAAILVSANRGRDLRPFLFALDAVAPARHALVCKLHTKLSRHRSDGSAWRRDMLRGLLGGPEETKRVLDAFARDPKLGLLAPASHLLPLRGYLGNSANARWVRALAAAAGMTSIPPESAFVGGSMFWLRPEALRPSIRAAFRADAFEGERGDVDGTLAHGWERFIGVAVAAAGYRLCDVADLADSPGRRAAADAKRDERHGRPMAAATAEALLSAAVPAVAAPAPKPAAPIRLAVREATDFAAVASLADLFAARPRARDRVFVHDEARDFDTAERGLAAGVNLFGAPGPAAASALGRSPMRSAYSFACDGGVLLPESGAVATADGGLVGVTIENAHMWGGIQFREPAIRERDGAFYAAWDARRIPALDTLVLGGLGINLDNYGHFLFDGLPGLFLLAQALRGIGRDFQIVVPALNRWHRECFDLAGLGAHLLRAEGPVRCATLASNSLVSHHVDSPTRFCRPVFDAMRFAVARDPAAPERVFFARRGFRRSMRNAEAVEARLRRRGFAVAAPEALSVSDQIRLVSRARVLIGQTGAALANIAFAAPGTRVLEIMPAVRPDRWIRCAAAILGHAWHVLLCPVEEKDFVGVRVGGRYHPAEDFSYSVPIAALDAALDAIEAGLEPATAPRATG